MEKQKFKKKEKKINVGEIKNIIKNGNVGEREIFLKNGNGELEILKK